MHMLCCLPTNTEHLKSIGSVAPQTCCGACRDVCVTIYRMGMRASTWSFRCCSTFKTRASAPCCRATWTQRLQLTAASTPLIPTLRSALCSCWTVSITAEIHSVQRLLEVFLCACCIPLLSHCSGMQYACVKSSGNDPDFVILLPDSFEKRSAPDITAAHGGCHEGQKTVVLHAPIRVHGTLRMFYICGHLVEVKHSLADTAL